MPLATGVITASMTPANLATASSRSPARTVSGRSDRDLDLTGLGQHRL